jgi:hypothetical protein
VSGSRDEAASGAHGPTVTPRRDDSDTPNVNWVPTET